MGMTNDENALHSYTQTDAAKAVGLSRSTIRRRRENGHFPNAWKTKDGEWMIPELDLLNDDLELAQGVSRDAMPTMPTSDSPTPPGMPSMPTAPAQPDLELIERLHRAELAAVEARAEAGIERARADGLQTALEEARAGRAEAQQRASDNHRSLQIIELFKQAEADNIKGELSTPAEEPTPAKKRWWQI